MNSAQVLTATPLTAVTRSPGRRPPCSAGPAPVHCCWLRSGFWSATHCIWPTTGAGSSRLGRPQPIASTTISRKPSRKFITMPPTITTRRFQVAWRYMARSSSSGRTSSSAVMPAMSQKPPSGIALRPSNPHAGGLRRPHVPAFVQCHRDEDAECEQHEPDGEHH
ncbi:Uncharacterised protein [Mycobacteroides abscessus subsp. abscessus]|nr:Uncharacterised protein [Mycobacteroides abscessus subsp. abscessus]